MSEQRDRYVYAIDDEQENPCYIGVGKGRRMYHHAQEAKSGKSRNSNSIKFKFFVECLARGFVLQPYKVAEDLTISEAIEYEKTLIAWYGRRDLGTGNLLNASAGGFGVKNMSERTRVLIANKTREAMSSPELRAKISKIGKERFLSPEARADYSIKTCNQWASEEGRAKFAVKAKIKWTPELRVQQAERTREQIAKAGKSNMLGKKHSTESRAKMKESSLKFWTPERRAEQADRIRGKVHSPETRAKMSISQRNRKNSSEARVRA